MKKWFYIEADRKIIRAHSHALYVPNVGPWLRLCPFLYVLLRLGFKTVEKGALGFCRRGKGEVTPFKNSSPSHFRREAQEFRQKSTQTLQEIAFPFAGEFHLASKFRRIVFELEVKGLWSHNKARPRLPDTERKRLSVGPNTPALAWHFSPPGASLIRGCLTVLVRGELPLKNPAFRGLKMPSVKKKGHFLQNNSDLLVNRVLWIRISALCVCVCVCECVCM